VDLDLEALSLWRGAQDQSARVGADVQHDGPTRLGRGAHRLGERSVGVPDRTVVRVWMWVRMRVWVHVHRDDA
jgi:hypothetical protein